MPWAAYLIGFKMPTILFLKKFNTFVERKKITYFFHKKGVKYGTKEKCTHRE
jgi:hypothetical protein